MGGPFVHFGGLGVFYYKGVCMKLTKEQKLALATIEKKIKIKRKGKNA